MTHGHKHYVHTSQGEYPIPAGKNQGETKNALEFMKGVGKSTINEIEIVASNIGLLSGDKTTNPLLFIVQPIFVAAYVGLIVVSLFSSYFDGKAKETAAQQYVALAYVIGVGVGLGFYVPTFFRLGENANDSQRIWSIARPIITAHIIVGLVSWLLAQFQTCDIPGQCPKSNALRKFFDSFIAPTRAILQATTPFNMKLMLNSSPAPPPTNLSTLFSSTNVVLFFSVIALLFGLLKATKVTGA